MRTGKIKVAGNVYLAAMTPRVMIQLQERNGKQALDELADIISTDIMDYEGIAWLVSKLTMAGDIYAKKMGFENPGSLTEDDVLDLVSVADFPDLVISISDAVVNSNEQTIKTETERKNAQATPAV